MSKPVLKLSFEDAEYVQSLRRRAIEAMVYMRILPEREPEIFDIVCCFIELTTPPAEKKPREIAKLVDEGIAAEIKKGMPLEAAVTSMRKFYARLYGKSVAAVKAAHLRHGTLGVTKKQKV